MADGRRIKFSSYVTVAEEGAYEEGIDKLEIFHPSIKKPIGGSGIFDLNSSQWHDQWIFGTNSQLNWEDYTDTTDGSGNDWEDQIQSWGGSDLSIGTGATAIASVSTAVDQDVAFLYIENTSDPDTSGYIMVSLNGTSGNYYLYCYPGESISVRGGDSGFHVDDVYVKSSAGTHLIKYVLAKK